MNNSGQANQASAGSQNAKFECKAAKFNRKRPLLPPVGISGTAPNKNRSLLRPVRQLSQKCRSLYFGWKKWRHGVYSSSLLLNMYVTRTRPMWARGSVTVVLGYVDIDGTKNVRHYKGRINVQQHSIIKNRLVVTIQVVKIGVLESARRFRDELQRRLNLALVTSVATKE